MISDFRLKVFSIVAKTLSFTRTATELHISQPAVTKHIKELELIVGSALFFRQGNKISITEKGKLLLPYARQVLKSYSEMNDCIDIQDNNFRGIVHIGGSTTIAQYVLPPILAKFRKEYPDIEIILTCENTEVISRKVITDELNMGIVEGNDIKHSLHYEHFAKDEVVLVTANGSNQNVSLNDLHKVPLVTRENGSGTLAVVEQALAVQGIPRKNMNISMQIGSSEGIIRFLMHSNCYAFLSRAAIEESLKEKKLHIVEIRGLQIFRSFRFTTLHGKNDRLSSLVKQFCLKHYNQ